MIQNADLYYLIIFILSVLLILVLYTIWIFNFIKPLNIKLSLIKLLKLATLILLFMQLIAIANLITSLKLPLATTEIIRENYIVDITDKTSDWQLLRSDNGLVKVKKASDVVGVNIKIYEDTAGNKYYVLHDGRELSKIYGRVLAERGDTDFDTLHKAVLDRKAREKDELSKIGMLVLGYLCGVFLLTFGLTRITVEPSVFETT